MPQGSENISQTNSDAAQFFGQQNLAAQQNRGGGGYGGGGDGESNYDDMFRMMEQRFNQQQQASDQEFSQNTQAMGMQNRMQNSNVDKARERDRKAFAELLNQKQQLIIKDQMLQIQMSQADSSNYDQIRQQLLQNEQKKSELEQIEVESNFEVSGAQKEVQEGIANSYNTINEHKIARDTLLKTAFENIKEQNEQGNNKGVSNTLDSWNKTKGKFYSVSSLPTRALTGIGQAGEYLYELGSGDNVSDVDISETYGLYSGGKGLQPGCGLGLRASNPEMEAYYNSSARQDAELAANAEQEARNRIIFGQNLATGGAGLLGGYYSGQTNALAPFQSSLGLQGSIESLGMTPLQVGAELGGRSATAGANAGRYLLTGGLGAAETMQKANSFSPLATGLRSISGSAAGTATNRYLESQLKKLFSSEPDGGEFGRDTQF